MFGGLDLKGGSAASAKATSDESPSATDASAAPPVSAFSFLMGTTTTASSDANNPGAQTKLPEASLESGSGFSFLNPSSTPVPPPAMESTNSSSTNMIPSPTESNTTNSNAFSSFNFMSTPSAPTTDAAPSTAFSFLQPPVGTTESTAEVTALPAPVVSEPAIHALDYKAPPTTTTGFDLTSPPAAPFGTPGTGVVFGSAATKGAVKKRTRTAKIGAAAQPPMAGISLPPPVASSSNEPAATSPPDVRDAALAASQRAEAFLRAKQEQEALATVKESEARVPAIRSVPSEEDEVIAAAKAAAKEAHKLEAQKNASRSHSGGFSSLFRTRAKSETVPATISAQQAPAVSMSTSSTSMGSLDAVEPSPPDRIQKEQEDVKRAMAERQWQMMQQKRQETIAESKMDTGTIRNISTETGKVLQNNTPSLAASKGTSAAVPPPPSQSPVRSLMTPSFMKPSPSPPAVLDAILANKPKSPTDVFHDMLADFRNEVEQSMNEVIRLRQHRAGLLEERFVTNAKERLAVQQKKQAELYQIAAAESEDFDLADQMSAAIDRHDREQAEYSAILENIGRAISELDRQKIQCVESVTQCFVKIQDRLSVFQKEQESADTKNATESLAKFTVVSKQLSAEQERLQNDLKHIERDSELIADERKELEKAISEQSGEYEKLRDQARGRLAEVEEEIEELRKQLQLKQTEAAKLRTEAAGHDESVLKVRVKFARQLTRLQKKEMTIKDNKDEWESEKRTFEANKAHHDLEVREHSEAMLARDSLLDALGKEIEMADTFASIVSKEIGFEVNAGTDEPECDNELAQMQANVVKCEAAVSESKSALKAVTSVLQSLEQEIQTLERQIPQLEEIKKASAEKRDFKGAGKASKEIKEATVRLAECKEELEKEVIGRKKVAEAEHQNLEQELEEIRRIAHEMERESGVAAMMRLSDNIKRLVTTKDTVCGSCTERSVPGVGAFVLDAQIKVLMMEGQAYGDKYGGWTELLVDIGVPSSQDEVPSPVVPEPELTVETDSVKPEMSADATEDDAMVNEVDDSSLQERMTKFRDVSNRLKECEDQLEASVASEDFEKAAELDEVLQQLLAEVQALNMTDEEMERALSNSDDVDVAAALATEAPCNDLAETADDCPPEIKSLDEENVDELATVDASNDDIPEENGNSDTPPVKGHSVEDDSLNENGKDFASSNEDEAAEMQENGESKDDGAIGECEKVGEPIEDE